MKHTVWILPLFFMNIVTGLFAQESGLYMTREIKQAYENGTRSWDGQPGQSYWVNHTDYDIDVEFDPQSLQLSGHLIATYTNYSPDTLKYIVLKIKQNMYQKGAARDHQINKKNVFEGVSISKVAILKNGKMRNQPRRTTSLGTNYIVNLNSEDYIFPGKSIQFSLDWALQIPAILQSRTGKANDSTYFIGYWFPQLAVYDDIVGWDTDHYLGIVETYNDLSDFDVKIKVPGNFLLWATGELQNPEEIYSDDLFQRIQNSKISDTIHHLVTQNDLPNKNLLKDTKYHYWHFKANEVPDFSFALSNHYVWDATSVVVNNETRERCWVNVVYPDGQTNYDLGVKAAGESIAYFSNVFPGIQFPYHKHISVFGDFASGMEFPMMANDGDMGDDISDFYDLVAHEIAHTYFPFYVNTNEKLYSWMDESWVTNFGTMFTTENGFNYPPFFDWLDNLGWNTFTDLPPMVPTKNLHQMEFMHQSYVRPKFSNVFLMEMFEEKGLPKPIKAYIERWKGKHPTPYDFFFTMNDLFGENLDWYWKPWYFEFCSPDLSIEEVHQSGNNVTIRIKNTGQMPLPVDLSVYFEDGSSELIQKSAYIWKNKSEMLDFTIKSQSYVKRIELGNSIIPDVNKKDNTWQVK